jgi:hypothetical protein
MKKLLFSLASVALLLSSCGSDENVPDDLTSTGEIVASIQFDGSVNKSSVSKAIPITSWSNVNQVQMLLYKADGTVAYSRIVKPSDGNTSFSWNDVPVGTYNVALVANVNYTSDNIATTLEGAASTNYVEYTNYNVVSKKINSEIFIDLKGRSAGFPAEHDFTATNASYKPYLTSSEVFTAYETNVKIEEGKKKEIGPLALKREISLARILVDKENKTTAPKLTDVNFAHTSCLISIENMPVGLGLKLDTFEGGIYGTSFNNDRVIIGAYGTAAYNTQDPASGYKNPAGGAVTILGNEGTDKYTLWQDIRVLPNVTKAELSSGTITTDGNVEAENRYKVRISGWVPAGYEFEDGSKASVAQPVYWKGTIKGAFTSNKVREVKISIKTKGEGDITEFVGEGELVIEVGAPEDWNSVIETESLDV